MKIKAKLITTFILISLIPLILISVIFTSSAQKALKESIKSNFKNLAKEKASAIAFIIEARIDEAERLAATLMVRTAVQESNRAYSNKDENEIQGSIALIDKKWIGSKGKTEEANQILNNDLSVALTRYQNKCRERYGEIFVTDVKSATVAMTKILSDYYQADEMWWEYGFNQGRGGNFIDDRGYDASIGALAMGIVVPVKDNEEVIGVLKINFKIKEILDIVSRNPLGKTGFISLVRSNGNIITDSSGVTEREMTDMEKVMLQETEAGHGADIHLGQKNIMGYAPIDTKIFTRVHSPGERKGIWGEKWMPTRWFLFIDVAESESFAIINNLIYLIIIIVMIVISFVIGAALFISRSISIPIRALQKGTEIISAGDLTYKIRVQERSEIGQLADSFNKMTRDLQKITVSKDYVDNIIESMADILIVADPDTMIRTVNIATVKLLGYREDELIGKPINMIFAEEDSTRSGIEDLLEKGFISGAERTYLSKDDRKIFVLFSGSVMMDDYGNVQGIVCVASDITGRKLSEKHLKDSAEADRKKTSELIEKTEHIERFHKLTIGREHDMIRLKAEVNDLLERLGQPKKYETPGKVGMTEIRKQ